MCHHKLKSLCRERERRILIDQKSERKEALKEAAERARREKEKRTKHYFRKLVSSQIKKKKPRMVVEGQRAAQSEEDLAWSRALHLYPEDDAAGKDGKVLPPSLLVFSFVLMLL